MILSISGSVSVYKTKGIERATILIVLSYSQEVKYLVSPTGRKSCLLGFVKATIPLRKDNRKSYHPRSINVTLEKSTEKKGYDRECV